MRRRKRARLVLRLLTAERDHALLLGVICLFAMVFSLIFAQSSEARGERVRERIEYAYGTASVLPIEDDELIPYPHISHLADQRAQWLSDASATAARSAAAELGLVAYPRLRGALFIRGDEIAPFVAVTSADPARAWMSAQTTERTPPSAPSPDNRIAEGAPLSLAVQYSDEAVSTLAVPVRALVGRDVEGTIWLEAEWLWSELASRVRLPALPRQGLAAPIRPPTRAILASEMVVVAPEQDRHFEIAFELAELLREHEVEVLPWPERLASSEYGRITSRAPTSRLLLFAVAALALSGATSIAVQRRFAVTARLRVIGFAEQEVRRIYVAEVAVVALLAGALVAGGVTLYAALLPGRVAGEALRSTLLVGVIVPIGAAFFASRRQIRGSLTQLRAEGGE